MPIRFSWLGPVWLLMPSGRFGIHLPHAETRKNGLSEDSAHG